MERIAAGATVASVCVVLPHAPAQIASALQNRMYLQVETDPLTPNRNHLHGGVNACRCCDKCPCSRLKNAKPPKPSKKKKEKKGKSKKPLDVPPTQEML